MIPYSIARLCSGILILSKQHCLFSFVICTLFFSCICSCYRCECVCWDTNNNSWWGRYSCHHRFCHQMKEQEEELVCRRQWAKPCLAVCAHTCTHIYRHVHTHTHTRIHTVRKYITYIHTYCTIVNIIFTIYFSLYLECILCLQLLMLTDNPQQEDPGYAPTHSHGETPMDDHKWMMGTGRQLPIPQEEKQKGGVTTCFYAFLDIPKPFEILMEIFNILVCLLFRY